MKILFTTNLTQRLRAIAHLIDPLIDRDHSVYISSGGKGFRIEDHYSNCWKVSVVNKDSLKYISANFGIQVKHIDKVVWVSKKSKPINFDVVLRTDDLETKLQKTKIGSVGIPYNGFQCFTSNGGIIVGNPMCQSIKNLQPSIAETRQVLVIHPGGGRGIISPLYKHVDFKEVLKNNVTLLNSIFQHLTKEVCDRVVIKTHPCPYKWCDAKTIRDEVLPRIKTEIPVTVDDKNLIQLICESNFVINFGSSTTLWLLGGHKRWINVLDCALCDLGNPRRRDKIERAKNWFEWPQNVPFGSLSDVLRNYDTIMGQCSHPNIEQYRKMANLPTTNMVIDIIEKKGYAYV